MLLPAARYSHASARQCRILRFDDDVDDVITDY